jgi:ABC-type transport system substrate-binding protein
MYASEENNMTRARYGLTFRRAALGIAVGIAVVLGPAWSDPAAARPTQWTIVVSEKTGGADALSEHGTNSQYYLIPQVIEALTRLELVPNERTWGVVPVLAEKWSFPDPKTLVVEVKRGVKFQNGEELTAEHVKAAYDAFVTPEKPGRRGVILKALGKAEVAGKHTVKFQLPKPDLAVLAATTHLLVPPLARHSMTREQFEAKPIGSGPYRVVDWPKDGTVRLEAWDGYRSGKAFPEKLIVRHVPEPSTRVFELAAGTAQVAWAIPIESLPTIQANPKLEVVSLTGGSALSYVINLYKTTPPLRDKRVRQAMNYAVDRAAIVKTILGGRGGIMPAPLWSGWLGASHEIAPYTYDPDKAKALLTDAGFPNGFSFQWTVTQGVFVKDIEVAQAVANQLSKVGIKATVQPAERARLLAQRSEGDYDVLELIWTMSWHPAILLQFTLHAAYPEAKLASKWGPMPPELAKARALMEEAGAAQTLDEMGRGYVRLNQLMRDEAFWLFVNTVDTLWGIQKDTMWRPYPAAFPYYDDYWHRTGRKAPDSPTVPLVPK